MAPPPIGPIPEISDASQISLPIDPYVPTAAQIGKLLSAVTVLARQCMASFGIAYTDSPDYGLDGADDYRRTRTAVYGFFDVHKASRSGYDTWVSGPEVGASDSLTADQRAVLYGSDSVTTYDGRPIPVGGCQQQSLDSVGGLLLGPDEESLPDGGPKTPVSDPRIVAAFRKWSDCMKAAGFSYHDPLLAISDPAWAQVDKDGQHIVTPLEIATATADVQCKISTNLVGVAVAVQTAYDNQYIDSHVTQLAAFKASLDERLRKAAATR